MAHSNIKQYTLHSVGLALALLTGAGVGAVRPFRTSRPQESHVLLASSGESAIPPKYEALLNDCSGTNSGDIVPAKRP